MIGLEKDTLTQKVEHSLNVIEQAIENYPKIAVACSAGKDSMVVTNLAMRIKSDIDIFSIMTPHKPYETFQYLVDIVYGQLGANLRVFIAAKEVPKQLKPLEDRVILVPLLADRYEKYSKEISASYFLNQESETAPLFKICPSLCCDLLKTDVTKIAVKDLDAWVCGLRNTECTTREDYREVEERGQGLIKINPILTWTEEEVWSYLKNNSIPTHSWYAKKFEDGKRIRSLGCAPCTVPIYDHQKERDGRWKGTSKCGGECGIHTQPLK